MYVHSGMEWSSACCTWQVVYTHTASGSLFSGDAVELFMAEDNGEPFLHVPPPCAPSSCDLHAKPPCASFSVLRLQGRPAFWDGFWLQAAGCNDRLSLSSLDTESVLLCACTAWCGITKVVCCGCAVLCANYSQGVKSAGEVLALVAEAPFFTRMFPVHDIGGKGASKEQAMQLAEDLHGEGAADRWRQKFQ